MTQKLMMKIKVANHFYSRLIGLMGKQYLQTDEGIYFPRCKAVHTCFMRFPIMLVFCKGKEIVRIDPYVNPWRYKVCVEADSVFEFNAYQTEFERGFDNTSDSRARYQTAQHLFKNQGLVLSAEEMFYLRKRLMPIIQSFFLGISPNVEGTYGV